MDTQAPKKSFLKSRKFLYSAGIIVFLYIIISGASSAVNRPSTSSISNTTASEPQPSATDREKAKSDLTDLMKTAEKATLVSSYEFSESKTVVYVEATWYAQPVSFKKDFMAKVASLKETITGYKHFEVRDAYSDKKVAEVTAFSSSLEVYK